MKKTEFFLLLFILCCVSCDFSTPFVIDGQKEYVLSSECGTIKIKGSSFSTSVFIGCAFNGKYSVNIDLLKMEAASSEDTITNIRFRLNNEEFTGQKIETKGGEVLTLSCNLQSTIPYQKSTGIILILSSNFITCEEKPIITDTIRIQIKN
jgi:pyruvate-formate lyase-activating enzyme